MRGRQIEWEGGAAKVRWGGGGKEMGLFSDLAKLFSQQMRPKNVIKKFPFLSFSVSLFFFVPVILLPLVFTFLCLCCHLFPTKVLSFGLYSSYLFIYFLFSFFFGSVRCYISYLFNFFTYFLLCVLFLNYLKEGERESTMVGERDGRQSTLGTPDGAL